MKTCIIAALLAVSFVPVLAHECKAPPKLKCDRLQQLVAERCPAKADVICPELTCNCDPCPEIPKVELAAATAHPITRTFYLTAPPVKPKGLGFLAGGPMYFHGTGLGANGGYRFANGVVVSGVAGWIPQNNVEDYYGTAQRGCTRIPFIAPGVEAKDPWMVGAFVGYSWSAK